MQHSPILLSRSVVGREKPEAAVRVLLKDGYLGIGREVQAFEGEIAEFLGVS